jgi:hypothetical protein
MASVTRNAALMGLAVFGLAVAAYRPKRKKKATRRVPSSNERGAIICPSSAGRLPASTGSVRPGDLVALEVADHARTYMESVWAIVEGIRDRGAKTGPDGMLVRITGKVGRTSVRAPRTEMHGYDLGQRVMLGTDCAWDVFHVTPKGMALCGLYGDQASESESVGASASPGDEAKLFLAPVKHGTVLEPGPGWNIPNPVWARVIAQSRSKNVLRVKLLQEPVHSRGVDLRKGDTIDIGRDCIYGLRPATSTE